MSRGERKLAKSSFQKSQNANKTFLKKFRKPLDKPHKVWYNNNVIRVATNAKRKGKHMKYTVSVNVKSKGITVTLPDGTVGTAKCCDTDHFNLATGIELALERAKVAKANAEKPAVAKSGDVMELVKALEKALPKGQMVLVGNGVGLTEAQKAWLHSLTDCKGGCSCDCCDCEDCDCDEEGDYYTEDEIEAIKSEAYDDGYNEGYRDGEAHSDDEIANAYDEGYADAVTAMRRTLADME